MIKNQISVLFRQRKHQYFRTSPKFKNSMLTGSLLSAMLDPMVPIINNDPIKDKRESNI